MSARERGSSISSEQEEAATTLTEEREDATTANIGEAGVAPAGASAASDADSEYTDADKTADPSERTALLDDNLMGAFRGRWQKIQADFVDDPRDAVAKADAMVAEVMKRVADEFTRERHGLEEQWSEGGEASTEDLRLAFQRYRSFFSRLLNL
jgi:hypothetical protein